MSSLYGLWNNSPKAVWQAIRGKIAPPRVNPQWTQVKAGPLIGGQLYIDVDSFAGWNDMINGRFDSFIYDELGASGNIDGAVFWDIGAHFGYHSLSFASLVGETGHVYSFEPNPFNVARYQMHLAKNETQAKRMTLNTFALSDADGEIPFVFSDDVDNSSSSGSHLQKANAPLDEGTYRNFKCQTVMARSIDSFIKDPRVRIPDIMKIDVEGAELLVLKGGKAFFQQHKPTIVMEVHNILMMYYVHAFLLKHGYSVRVLDESNSTLSKCFVVARPV